MRVCVSVCVRVSTCLQGSIVRARSSAQQSADRMLWGGVVGDSRMITRTVRLHLCPTTHHTYICITYAYTHTHKVHSPRMTSGQACGCVGERVLFEGESECPHWQALTSTLTCINTKPSPTLLGFHPLQELAPNIPHFENEISQFCHPSRAASPLPSLVPWSCRACADRTRTRDCRC